MLDICWTTNIELTALFASNQTRTRIAMAGAPQDDDCCTQRGGKRHAGVSAGIDVLPDECLAMVLSHVEQRTRLRLPLVCKRWAEVTNSFDVYQQITFSPSGGWNPDAAAGTQQFADSVTAWLQRRASQLKRLVIATKEVRRAQLTSACAATGITWCADRSQRQFG